MYIKPNRVVVAVLLALLLGVTVSVASAHLPLTQPVVASVWSTTPKTTVDMYTYTSSLTSIRFQFSSEDLADKYYLGWFYIILDDNREVGLPIDKEGWRAGIIVDCSPVTELCTATEISASVGSADNIGNTISRARYVFRGRGVPLGIEPVVFLLGTSEASAAKQMVARWKYTQNIESPTSVGESVTKSAKSAIVIPFAKLEGTGKRNAPVPFDGGK